MASLTTSQPSISLATYLCDRKFTRNSPVISWLKEELEVNVPSDFEDLEDEHIDSFIKKHKLKPVTKKRLLRAYREIKYGETQAVDSPRSRTSSTHSRSGSMVQVDEASDGSIIVKNYRIRKDQPLLSGGMRSHCDVLLAETHNFKKTPLVAKISTDATSAAALQQECELLKHIHAQLGRSANNLIVELIDWVER